jgi:hypothetical protein
MISVFQDLTGTFTYPHCQFSLQLSQAGDRFSVRGRVVSGNCQDFSEDLTFAPSCLTASGTYRNADGSTGVDIWSRQDPIPEEYVLTVTYSDLYIAPSGTGRDSETIVTAALITSNETSPLIGRSIAFSSVSVDFSGGHNHPGERPKGRFSNTVCVTDALGKCSVVYKASEVSGHEKIVASLAEDPTVKVSKTLEIKIPDLFELGSSPFYRLTGTNTSHPSNHYISVAVSGALSIFPEFYEEFGATLGLNDTSLEMGGLFDLGPEYGKPFWSTPHRLHRAGRSFDIDKCALVRNPKDYGVRGPCPPGWILVPRDRLQEMCEVVKGRMVPESTIHCEF